jgi:hypothetical protein
MHRRTASGCFILRLALVCTLGGMAAGVPALAETNAAAAGSAADAPALKWLPLSDKQLEVCGLPWIKENGSNLWRFPGSARDIVPRAVWSRAQVPDGGRIRLSCNSTRLAIRAQAVREVSRGGHFDAFVNGEYVGSVRATRTQAMDLVFFENKDRARRDITIYLPNNQQVQVVGVGVDADAQFHPPPPFARKQPMVCYGSSVLQGTGASHPSTTYPAALARALNLDFVNLGFGGAGKGEPEVVALVNQLDACCYLFDLGKSYGAPTPERYAKMLDTIRASHPGVPILCVTPIYSIKEGNEPAYRKRSEDLRVTMRQAANDRRQAGDKQMLVVEGLELFGEADKDFFHDPLHPNDEGNKRMATRLAPVVKKAVFGEERPIQETPKDK